MNEASDNKKRISQIKIASIIAVGGNAVLAFLKITIGLWAGSLAVIGDGIDTFTDVFTSLITLYAAYFLSKPPDATYSYGYQRIDTVATKALSFVIFFAGAQLAFSSIGRLFSGTVNEMPQPEAIFITIFSIVIKLLLAWFLLKKGKSLQSGMLDANGKNMRNDVLLSGSVLLGLFFTFVLQLPILDTITAIFVSFWVMKIAIEIFLDSSRELMDGIKNKDIYKQVFDSIAKVESVGNPHKLRIRKIGNSHVVAVDIELPGYFTVEQAHEIAKDVETQIKNVDYEIYDVLVHIEPSGNSEPDEKFGLTEKDII